MPYAIIIRLRTSLLTKTSIQCKCFILIIGREANQSTPLNESARKIDFFKYRKEKGLYYFVFFETQFSVSFNRATRRFALGLYVVNLEMM